MKISHTVFSPFNSQAAHMIEALKYLHQMKQMYPDSYIASRAVANAIGLSNSTFESVAKVMVRNNWIKSQKGPGGGYIVDVDIEKLTVYDVISSAFSSPIKDNAFIRLSKDLALSQF